MEALRVSLDAEGYVELIEAQKASGLPMDKFLEDAAACWIEAGDED